MLVRPKLPPRKKPQFSIQPDFIAESIVGVNFKYLKKLGVKACLIDLDGTVVSSGTFEVDKRIGKVLSKAGLPIHIATNRPKSRSLKTLKEDLHAVSVIHPHGLLGKPSKHYYNGALKELHLKPHEVVMIGDRYIQDTIGANRAGIYSLLVHKLGVAKGKGDLYFSMLEQHFTKRNSTKYQKSK